jgi:hypothetical protein
LIALGQETKHLRGEANLKDPYLDLITEQWENILQIYRFHRGKKPVIQYELPIHRIYVYPAETYIDTLSDRTREQTRQQYRKATESGRFLLFIRDAKKKVLKSYIFEAQEILS